MTRYARAKGSKASNERLPEEATPWHVMQQQMLNQNQETRETVFSTTELNKKNITVTKSMDENKSATWTSFSNESEITYSKNEAKKKKKTVVNKQRKENSRDDTHSSSHESDEAKLKRNCERNVKIRSKCIKVSGKESSNKRSLQISNGEESNFKKVQLRTEDPKVSGSADDNKWTINKCASRKKVDEGNNELDSKSPKSVEKKTYKDEKLLHRKFKTNVNKEVKKSGLRTGRENNYPSRMVDNESFTMYCNGKPVQVVHYDGFLIKEKDAEELNKLKLQLIAKGIPRNEYLAILKLERRKAEKALARERKNVCYRCRKSGHNFSECPEIEKDGGALGYCFKCGSTEHTHLGCKVNRGDEYRYAQCFLCKEEGHIARQCPDNPRGLYPKGGACHLCGDVTHFKKDCPKNIEEKEKNSVTVETLNKNFKTIEALDEDLHSKSKTKKLSKMKIVVF